jgi:hypothetical protein
MQSYKLLKQVVYVVTTDLYRAKWKEERHSASDKLKNEVSAKVYVCMYLHLGDKL